MSACNAFITTCYAAADEPTGPDHDAALHRVVAQCTAPGTGLPEDKPRYVMGIGYPLDIVVCSGGHLCHGLCK